MSSLGERFDTPAENGDPRGERIPPIAWWGLAAAALLAVCVLAAVIVAERSSPETVAASGSGSQLRWTQLASVSGSGSATPVRSEVFAVSSDMVGLTYSVDRTSSAPNALMVALYKADGEVFDLPVFSREAGVESLLLDAPPGDYYLEAVGVFCDWTVAVNEAK